MPLSFCKDKTAPPAAGHRYQIYKNLARLNSLAPRQAGRVLAQCCASPGWVRAMTDARPYPMLADLFDSADEIWRSLGPAEWLEAIETEASENQTARGRETIFRLYRERFGFPFVIDSPHSSVNHQASVARARIGNSRKTELIIAAAETAKITGRRLTQLLER